MAKKKTTKKHGEQIKLAYKKGSLDPLAQAALAKGGKYLIAYYQDEIAKMKALAAREVGICNDMLDRDNVQMAQNDIDLKAQANEIGFWKAECERYRDQIVALLRGKAYPTRVQIDAREELAADELRRNPK